MSSESTLSSSSESNGDWWWSDPLLLKELDERKSRVSKNALSSSSVSAASYLSCSSELLALPSEMKSKNGKLVLNVHRRIENIKYLEQKL